MKTFTAVTLLIFINVLTIKAQDSLVNFKETHLLVDGIEINVGNTVLKGNEKQIKKSWANFIKKQTHRRVHRKKNIYTVKKVVVNQITDKRGDLITFIYRTDNKISVNIAYKLGYDVYLTSNHYPEDFKRLEKFTQFFVYNYYNDFLPVYIKSRTKDLKMLKKEEKRANKKVNKSRNKILVNQKRVRSIEKKNEKLSIKAEASQDSIKKNDINFKIENLRDHIARNNEKIDELKAEKELRKKFLETIKKKKKNIRKDIDEAKLTLLDVKTEIKNYK